MSKMPDTVTLELDRIGVIHVSWAYHNDLLVESKLTLEQLVTLQRRQAVYQIAEAIAEYIKWEASQYIEPTQVTTIVGSVKVIKP